MIFEEFDFINFLVAIISILIIYFAWKSTYVREERLPPTAVLIIENNRRQFLENFHRQRIPQAGATPSIREIIDEVNVLSYPNDQRPSTSNSNNITTLESFESDINQILENSSDSDQQDIIEQMDNPDTAEGLRRRRLAFYTHETSTAEPIIATTTATVPASPLIRENLNSQQNDSVHSDNCSNENNENEHISKNENNRTKSKSVPQNDSTTSAADPSNNNNNNNQNEALTDDKFRIKLKYLNDDLRLVTGSPNEQIGDFRRRNFTVELAAEKLVRLVFNGHVLEPDSKTLQACGLFDNCVVHCLVHKKPANRREEGQNQQTIGDNQRIRNNIGSSSFLDVNTNGPLFIYLGIAVVTMAIVFCWYCRIQYSSLFSLYSTVGLVLMTALFLIIFPLVILIERDVST